MTMRLSLLALLLTLASSTAAAAEWVIDYPHSKLGFTGAEGSTAFDGQFTRFRATVDLDPQHPAAGRITAAIDTGSATAGKRERDELLPQADWFNVSKFPEAQFASTAIRQTGAGAFEATGTLTIKGITQAVKLPFTLTQESDHWRARGTLTLMRTDFGVGSGEWADEKMVRNKVEVTVDLVAMPSSENQKNPSTSVDKTKM